MATRKVKITLVGHIIFRMDSAELVQKSFPPSLQAVFNDKELCPQVFLYILDILLRLSQVSFASILLFTNDLSKNSTSSLQLY